MSNADQAARSLLSRCARAYQTLPAFSGRNYLYAAAAEASDAPPPASLTTFALGQASDAMFDMDGYGATVSGDAVYLFQRDHPNAYIQAVFDGDILSTLETAFGAALFVPPQIVLRTSDTPKDWINALGLGLVSGLRPVSVEPVTDDIGYPVDILHLDGQQGAVKATFNARSARLSRIEVTLAGTAFSYVIEDEETKHPAPIRVDKDGRTRVNSFSGYRGAVAQVGGPVPDVTLPLINGDQRSTTPKNGRWLVLDFWALWCRPCLAEIPKLDALAGELRASNTDVDIVTIALVDQSDSARTQTKIRNMWSDGGFDLPIMVDFDEVMAKDAFAIRSIPSTVIVSSDGTVADIQSGMTAAQLRSTLEKLGAIKGG